MRARRAGLLAALAAMALGQAASAQPGASPFPQPPVLPGAPAPAVPDTVDAQVRLAVGAAPRAIEAQPPSVDFGGEVTITILGEGLAAADSLVLPPWLELVGVDGPEAGALAVTARVYGVDAFRVRQGDAVSNVVSVVGLGTDGSLTAPVRDPRRPGWNIGTILLLLAAAGVLAVLLSRIRRRRRTAPADLPVAGAAWPALALDLETAWDRLAREGDTRAFLDALAAVARAYAADRFRIAGREMTGAEVVEACRRLGYPADVGRSFGRLIDELDGRRYDRGALTTGYCREQAAILLSAVEQVRLPLDPAADAAQAQEAWRRLTEAMAAGGGARA